MVDQKRGSRGRSLLALVACAVIAAASILWVLPARGDSTWRDGWCRQGEGQTVVIDWSTYPDLVTAIPGTDGGTTLVRCIVFPEGEPRSYTSTTGDGRTQPLDDAGIPWAGSGLITEINGIEAEGLDSYEWWFYTIGYDDGHRNRDNHRDGHDHRDGQVARRGGRSDGCLGRSGWPSRRSASRRPARSASSRRPQRTRPLRPSCSVGRPSRGAPSPVSAPSGRERSCR